jgi:hypothetical protein
MRVRTVPIQSNSFLNGGFDIQMIRTNDIFLSLDVDVRPLDWWSRDESYDILHVWGLNRQHQNLVQITKGYGKKGRNPFVALSFAYDVPSPLGWAHQRGQKAGYRYFAACGFYAGCQSTSR